MRFTFLLSLWLSLLGFSALSCPKPCPADTTIAQDELPHVTLAYSYVGHTEVSNNSSPLIDHWLALVGLPPGNPYCAAFTSAMLYHSNVVTPKVMSGLARHFKTPSSIDAKHVFMGLVEVPVGSVAVWQRGETIFGHAGIVAEWDGIKGKVVEANTSSGAKGSQWDGEGVWVRDREIQPYSFFRIIAFTPVLYE